MLCHVIFSCYNSCTQTIPALSLLCVLVCFCFCIRVCVRSNSLPEGAHITRNDLETRRPDHVHHSSPSIHLRAMARSRPVLYSLHNALTAPHPSDTVAAGKRYFFFKGRIPPYLALCSYRRDGSPPALSCGSSRCHRPQRGLLHGHLLPTRVAPPVGHNDARRNHLLLLPGNVQHEREVGRSCSARQCLGHQARHLHGTW